PRTENSGGEMKRAPGGGLFILRTCSVDAEQQADGDHDDVRGVGQLSAAHLQEALIFGAHRAASAGVVLQPPAERAAVMAHVAEVGLHVAVIDAALDVRAEAPLDRHGQHAVQIHQVGLDVDSADAQIAGGLPAGLEAEEAIELQTGEQAAAGVAVLVARRRAERAAVGEVRLAVIAAEVDGAFGLRARRDGDGGHGEAEQRTDAFLLHILLPPLVESPWTISRLTASVKRAAATAA